MAEVRTLLGAILRDIAEARVTSDLFSRDVGLEYLDDEVLQTFSVPRVDMKQATVRLRFAVNSLEVKETDPDKVIKRVGAERATPLANEVIKLVVGADPRRDELVALIRRKQIDLPGVVSRTLATVLSNVSLVRGAIEGNSQAFGKELQVQLQAQLTRDDEVKKMLVPSRTDRRLSTALRKSSELIIGDMVERTKVALETDKRPGLKLDLAVSRSELAEVPETIISEISVVAEMRNYVWSETEEEDGSVQRRLLPE